MIVTGEELAKAARNSKYDGCSYKEMDCQQFVENVLKDVGIVYNWLGSNHMYRDMVVDVDTISNIFAKYGEVPSGYICFTVKHDGKEPARYKDGTNAAHVGIVLDGGEVRHSTTGGVQYDVITNSSRWTHAGKHKDITYNDDSEEKEDILVAIYNLLKKHFKEE